MKLVNRLFRDTHGAMLVATGTEQDGSWTVTEDSPRWVVRRSRSPRPGAEPSKPLVAPLGNLNPGYQRVKRAADVVGALALLALFGPLMAMVFIVLSVATRGNALFVQERVGLCGHRFRMLKFRTMRMDAESLKHLIRNEQSGPVFKNRQDPRITRFGQFLRSTSIDELPQIFNVLWGDMTLVGPRPPVPGEVVQYKSWQLRRLSIKPGLTCLWQVSGRCEVGFEEWVRMDIRYAKRQGLMSDLWLLARTPWSVLSRRGAY